MNERKRLNLSWGTIAISVMSVFLFAGLVSAQTWNEPTANPPAGNAPAPINVTSATQTKAGIFNALYLNAVSGIGVGSGSLPSTYFQAVGTDSKVRLRLNRGNSTVDYAAGSAGQAAIAGETGVLFYTGPVSSQTLKTTMTTNGDWGFGITSPKAKLHVAGNIIADNLCYNSTTSPVCASIRNIVDGGPGDGGGQWLTSPANANNIYNSNTGNVGIGINNPTAKFQVVNGSQNLQISSKASGQSNIEETTATNFVIKNSASNGNIWLQPSGSGALNLNRYGGSGGIIFGDGGSGEVGRITTAGSFLLGPNSPSETVTGGTVYPKFIVRSSTVPSGSNYYPALYSEVSSGAGTNWAGMFNGKSGYGIKVFGASHLHGPLVFSGAGTPGVNKVLASIDANGMAEWKTLAELGGTTTTGGSLWGGSATGDIYNLNTGNVGLGTNAPANKLDITGGATNTGLYIHTTSTGSGASNGSSILVENSTGDLYITNRENSALRFWNNGVERMTILNSGNVGLGINVPQARLHLSGSIIADNLCYITLAGTPPVCATTQQLVQNVNNGPGTSSWATEGSNIRNSNTGNVIIGNNLSGFDNPSKLNVNGTAIVRDDLGTNGNFYVYTGNVGIRTNNPIAQLHVNGSTLLGGNVAVTGSSLSLPNIPQNNSHSRVLTSDASGSIGWRDVSSLGSTGGSGGGGVAVASYSGVSGSSDGVMSSVYNAPSSVNVTVSSTQAQMSCTFTVSNGVPTISQKYIGIGDGSATGGFVKSANVSSRKCFIESASRERSAPYRLTVMNGSISNSTSLPQ